MGKSGHDEKREDPAVRDIVVDGVPKPVEILTGFFGRSPQKGRCRLYLTMRFDSYLEFPENAIVRIEGGADSGSSRNTTVWLERDTDVTACHTANLRDERGAFLSGSLMTTVLSRTVPSQFEAVPAATEIPTWVICGISPIASIVISISRGSTDTACCSSCCCTSNLASTCAA